ncbi:P-loop containing nucleoside triphosphate hydrolase protein [Phanerochaete sordida]|uniref:P-loop containing nucleoside triphosphate hydrolase protein n=1 Tax=Phanerochaete sordida TaxID=48140 RepID=A0A9P3LB74_9APHY|nr:P-loop containing nucleoside triphosphate hydrolase protein [Phanerochaete sordida]
MDQIASDLADFLVTRFATIPATHRLIVGIAGVPASGKSTLAQMLVDHTNALLSGTPDEGAAILVGLDGWHLTRAQLDQFPDAKLAHDRRGAHWTFDGQSYVEFVRELRVPLNTLAAAAGGQEAVIYAPSFSHELKDPAPRAVAIHPKHRIVIIEGLYTFLGIEPWVEAAQLLDERWWVGISEEEAKERLVKRHVISGVAKDLEEAVWRATENDAPNGRFIKENMLQPTRIISSVEDPVLKSPGLSCPTSLPQHLS